MENFDPSKTIDISMNTPSRTHIPYLALLNSFTNSKELDTSRNWMCNGGTTMYAFKMAINGRQCSKPIKDCSNQQWCSSAYAILLRLSIPSHLSPRHFPLLNEIMTSTTENSLRLSEHWMNSDTTSKDHLTQQLSFAITRTSPITGKQRTHTTTSPMVPISIRIRHQIGTYSRNKNDTIQCPVSTTWLLSRRIPQ